MGKYFNINPTTGTGGLKTEEISVTPTSDFTGRGPVTENLIVELQDDAGAKQTVVCSRTGKKTTQTDFASSLKLQRSSSVSDTIPDSGWEDISPKISKDDEATYNIPLSGCWLRAVLDINLATCDFLVGHISEEGSYQKFFVRINGKYLTDAGKLVSNVTEYPQKANNENSGATVNIENDPGKLAQMSVEVIAKCFPANGMSFHAIDVFFDDNPGVSFIGSAVNYAFVVVQTSDTEISVSPESLNFETSTSEKKISVKAISPWRAYIQNA